MYFKSIISIFLTCVLGACVEGHVETSFSLQSALSDMNVTCDDLKQPRTGKLFWVKSVLDGTGILLVSKSNRQNEYDLSLTSHNHERAMETRIIECEKL